MHIDHLQLYIVRLNNWTVGRPGNETIAQATM